MSGGPQQDASSERGGGATAREEQLPHWGEKWLSESRRAYTSIGIGLILALPAQIVVQARGSGLYTHFIELLLLFVASYLGVYILLTALAFRVTPSSSYLPWAERSQKGTWVQHYVMGTHPGPGIAQSVSSFALVMGVFWFPAADLDGILPRWATGSLVALLVVEAWLTVVMTYSVAYLQRDARSGYRELGFPGDGPRRWTDYFYFSAGVSTTFATSDVDVHTTGMRRTVTGHSILAFGFNTVILAAVVSVLLR